MNLDLIISILDESDSMYSSLLVEGLRSGAFSIEGEALLAAKEQLARTYRVRLKRFSLNQSDYAKELTEQTTALCSRVEGLTSNTRVYGLSIVTGGEYEYRIHYTRDNEILGILKFKNRT